MSVSKILGKPQEIKLFRPSNKWVLPSCNIGAEFEYEGVSDPTFIQTSASPYAGLWEYHRDDSLKDEGAEFVFRAPLFGEDAYNAINWLMDYATNKKFKCSLRAGVHFHLDVRDMEIQQLIGLIILYTIVEPILYRFIGDNRENSIYCVPFYKADESLLDACSIITNALVDFRLETHSVIKASESFERYAGLNLNALSKYGSVEFRHLRTTHDKDRVFNWVNMIMSLKAATYRLPTSDGAIVKFAEQGSAMQLLRYIFGELADVLYTKESEKDLFEIGIPAARDLALHGCNSENWGQISYPKGVSKGLAAYLRKHQPKEKQQRLKEKQILDEAMELQRTGRVLWNRVAQPQPEVQGYQMVGGLAPAFIEPNIFDDGEV